MYCILPTYTAGSDTTYFLPDLTQVMESATIEPSANQTLSAFSHFNEKMACCEVGSPTEHLCSKPNLSRPHFSHLYHHHGFRLVCDLTPFELK